MTYFLKRHIGYYLIQVYFPDIFVVALSWIVFWMDKNDMGNRMAIGITTILTITFLLRSLNGFMPRVSYPKALDWYLLVSFTLTFLSLVECMIVFVVSMSENKEHDDQVCLIVFVSLYFLGPVHMYLFLSENRDFLSLSKKKTRSHLVLYNPFCPSTRKPNSDRKWYPPWWEHAHSLATEPVTKYFSKTSVFIHPHKHRKTLFAKSPHWRAFF